MGNGTLNTGTITVGSSGPTVTAAVTGSVVNATVTQNAGAVLADAVVFSAPNAGNGANENFQSVYNLGATATTGILSTASLTPGASAGNTAATRSTLNFNNGTITNYDNAANGFAGQGNANGSTTTNVQNLTITGLTGGGAAASNLTLNIALASTGVHNFQAEAGATITETATALISGSGALTANGAGTVILTGANTYAGGTNVTAGMLTAASNTALGTGNVALSAATTLTLNAGVVLNMPTTSLTLASGTTSLVSLLGTGVQDTVGQLVINGVQQPNGTYGAVGSGAANTTFADFHRPRRR